MTSGKLDVFEPITAAPQFMASKAGKPNPSCHDGKTKTLHKLYSTFRSFSETKPVKTISSDSKPCSRANFLNRFLALSSIAHTIAN